MKMTDRIFYIISASPNPDGGIYRYELINDENLRLLGFNELKDANYVCFSPDRKFLYSTCTYASSGGVAAFKINDDMSLEFLNSTESHGLSPCHVTCDSNGKFLFCANYRSGNVVQFKIAPDGSLEPASKIITHEGTGPNKARQEMAHTHCTCLTPDKKYLCVVDLGIDAVKVYPLDSEKGIIDTPFTYHSVPGDGPRHIIFDNSGKFAYLINELGNSVTSLSYDDGKLTAIKTLTTLPHNCTATTKASAIRFSPDEKFLFATNRGYDSIACYNLKGNGDFELYDILPSYGSSPRDINFLPGGTLFAAANEFSDSVNFYDYDSATGKLRYKIKEIRLTRPLNIEF